MVITVKVECQRSPDGKHDFMIGGRRYHFCKYCHEEEEDLKKEAKEKKMLQQNPPGAGTMTASDENGAKPNNVVKPPEAPSQPAEEKTPPGPEVPESPDRKKDFWGWVEFNSQEITSDYFKLSEDAFIKQWKITGTQLAKVRQKYNLYKSNKRREKAAGAAKRKLPKISKADQLNGLVKSVETLVLQVSKDNQRLNMLEASLEESQPATGQPVYPTFNESWGDQVKVEWLNAYGVLFGTKT